MDMKKILQALDTVSSRKVAGVDDMRRFVSVVKESNTSVKESSGYIPKNDKEAKDPRWSTALSVDVQPGAVEKNLKAFSLAEGKKTFLEYVTEAETVLEEKQKGVDGKACWDGYKRMGTKKKGGKTVDNCVPTGKK
jgi:hypothetical protein